MRYPNNFCTSNRKATPAVKVLALWAAAENLLNDPRRYNSGISANVSISISCERIAAVTRNRVAKALKDGYSEYSQGDTATLYSLISEARSWPFHVLTKRGAYGHIDMRYNSYEQCSYVEAALLLALKKYNGQMPFYEHKGKYTFYCVNNAGTWTPEDRSGLITLVNAVSNSQVRAEQATLAYAISEGAQLDFSVRADMLLMHVT